MKANDRRQNIMSLLLGQGSATVEDLSQRLGVSKMTIHRDLDALENEGLLRKVRGGASIESSAQFESDFRYRRTLAAEEKDRIAASAASLIEPGQTVIIDDSSTAGALTKYLVDLRPLTVITNNLSVVTELAPVANLNLISLGGQYSEKFNGFFGIACDETLRSLRADVSFLSSSAIHEATTYHQNQEVVQTKRLMIASSRRSHLLVDHTKFGRSALHYVSDLTAFDSVITDRSPSPASQVVLDEAGVCLSVAANPASR